MAAIPDITRHLWYDVEGFGASTFDARLAAILSVHIEEGERRYAGDGRDNETVALRRSRLADLSEGSAK